MDTTAKMRLISVLIFDDEGNYDTLYQKQKILEIHPRIGQAILGSLVAGVNFHF